MDLPLALNFMVWMGVMFGAGFATHSKYICDGILIKIGLIILGISAAAQGIRPSFNAQMLIGCSLMAIFFFAAVRLMVAKMKGKKPVFLAF